MEAFLFFTRFFVHEDGPSTPLEVSVITYPQAVVLRIAIDYTVIIDAAVAAINPSLASDLKKECLALHRHLFPWYLDLQILSHEYDRQQEGDYGEPSATRSSKASAAVKNNKGTIRKLFRRIATASNKHLIPDKKRDEPFGSDYDLYNEDSYTEYSDSDLSDTPPSAPDQPSIHLKYRKHSFWPSVILLARESWRPCSVLADPRYSHNLRVSRDDLSTWRDKRKPTSFRPRCVKVTCRGFACSLPNRIHIAGMQWRNPDGGAPKMQYLDNSDGLSEIDDDISSY